jgi:D-sedoheptulose 7-phosphate isomerase
MKSISDARNKAFWNSYVQEQQTAIKSVRLAELNALWEFVKNAYNKNQRIFVAGNGGLFSTAAHLAVDWTKGAVSKGPEIISFKRRLKVHQLGANGSKITAWANDDRYDVVYSQELRGEVDPDDAFSLLVLSCSGNSPNIVDAVKYARGHQNAEVFGIVGFDGGKVKNLVPTLHISSQDYGIVEDLAHTVMHWLLVPLKRLILVT